MNKQLRTYLGQLSTLLTGTGFANLVPILITPLLSRIYSPNEFGVLALFISITTIMGSISNGRYELAIVLPKEHRDSQVIALGSVGLALILAIFMLIGILVLGDSLVVNLGVAGYEVWLLFIPLSVLTFGVTNPLNYYHTRFQRYGQIARAKIARALVMAALQLILGFYYRLGATGLILGYLLANLIESILLIISLQEEKWAILKVDFPALMTQLKRYRRFPIYSAPGAISNTLSSHLVDVLIPAIYSAATLGQYALVNRVLGLPLRMIGQAVSQIYLQRAADDKNAHGSTWSAYRMTVGLLLILAVIIFAITGLLVEDVFGFVFGEEWALAGTYAFILLPLFFIRFIVSPISVTCSIYEKQIVALLWQVSLFLSLLINFFIVKHFEFDFISFLSMFTWTYFVLYIIMFAYTLYISLPRPKDEEHQVA